ncbi:hypothetical protein H2201_006292 [Coniosporium apollinis]|uniref:Uncharacterized protein n=1 Tax=Coniosporium apollinis TaxID=61459 RepID=A0ABQ9NMK1_9PEZI|nr:hypothetical protein H2201_006292 [Coniosporium apollinis]
MSDEDNWTYAERATWSGGRPCQGQGRQYDAPSGPALTVAHLAQLQEGYPVRDTHYAEDRVREEQIQARNRAIYDLCYPPAGVAETLDEYGRQQLRQQQARYKAEYLGADIKVYRAPTGSSALPLERFCTQGAAADPHPLFARTAMAGMGIKYADMESAPKRQRAAEESARSAINLV